MQPENFRLRQALEARGYRNVEVVHDLSTHQTVITIDDYDADDLTRIVTKAPDRRLGYS